MNLINFEINNYRGAIATGLIPLSTLSVFVGKNDSGKSIALNAVASYLDVKNYPFVELDFNSTESPIVLTGFFTTDQLRDKIVKKIGSKLKKEDGKDEYVNDVCDTNVLAVRKTISSPGKAYDTVEILMTDYDNEEFAGLYQKTDEQLSEMLEIHKIEIPVSGTGRNSKLEKIKQIKIYCEQNKFTKKPSWILDTYELSKLLPEIELFKSDYGIEADTAFKTTSVSEVKGVIEAEQSSGGKLAAVAAALEAEMKKESDSIASFMKVYVPNIKTVSITPNFSWKDAIKSVDVNFEMNDDKSPINMTHKGSGYRRLFMVARFRYLAEKKKGDNIIYAIEEPETFLHPSAQEDLLTALKELSENTQIILATHSPVFAGSSDKNAVILSEKTADGSKYYTASDDTELPKRVIRELGIRPHHNLRDKYTKILFCESKNDIMFFDTICEKVLGKNILGNADILALPGGGDSLEDIINIDYFTDTGRSLYLITDSDKHQEDDVQQKNIKRLDEFKSLDNSKGYMLRKACIENYYHPAAFSRVYTDIPDEKCTVFADDDHVKKKLKELSEETGVQIKHKNSHAVFNETTKDEWSEIIEDELVKFLKELTS